jgi:hypothetical protein
LLIVFEQSDLGFSLTSQEAAIVTLDHGDRVAALLCQPFQIDARS